MTAAFSFFATIGALSSDPGTPVAGAAAREDIMQALILGNGNMGRAIAAALVERGDAVIGPFGRAIAAPPEPSDLAGPDVAFEFSHASAVVTNVRYALASGCRRLVVGTTGWADDRDAVARLVDDAAASAIVAPSYSLGVALFARLAEEAARLFGRFSDYDPYLFEQHRRAKPDRPSGTAALLAQRVLPYLPSKRRARLADGEGAPDPTTLEIVSLRAGVSPGLHVFGFDAPGETVELRLTARDRSAYVAGALVAADRLLAEPGPGPGIHSFETVVAETLAASNASPGSAGPAQHIERSSR